MHVHEHVREHEYARSWHSSCLYGGDAHAAGRGAVIENDPRDIGWGHRCIGGCSWSSVGYWLLAIGAAS